ncbi:hypothetical protein MNBD_GAMMA25-439 [hydrothermal vent metagenome]|uniref:Prepilin-type N-terminal cleavage/methylation domain-containing protein n=1 Tax=hydrothermal vent metagenome TaxID=652676 RepID=A0A3B1BU15_9ZZZZ
MSTNKQTITRRLWLSNAKPNNQRTTNIPRMLGFALLSPTYSNNRQRGFTLIELVVAIVLLGIIGSMVIVTDHINSRYLLSAYRLNF